jgi:hypothetical protein
MRYRNFEKKNSKRKTEERTKKKKKKKKKKKEKTSNAQRRTSFCSRQHTHKTFHRSRRPPNTRSRWLWSTARRESRAYSEVECCRRAGAARMDRAPAACALHSLVID